MTGDRSSAPERIYFQPQPGPQTDFLSTPADIAIYGGAAGGGKSWALLAEPLRHITNPKFGAVIFRRKSTEIRHEGGLWDESMGMYPQLGSKPREHVLEHRFTRGGKITFAHLEHYKNVFDWQGGQIAMIGFDELTHFQERQFWYLTSRNRSTSGIKPYIRATCNADADSWVADLIAWWIDPDTGTPIPERSGVLRWYCRINDELKWGDSFEELKERYPQSEPKSLTFIPARLEDNQILMKADPGYLAHLLSLPKIDRARLLDGNWKIREAAGEYFREDMFEIVDPSQVPRGGPIARTWDLAGTEFKEGEDPDFTVSLAGTRGVSPSGAGTGDIYVTGMTRDQIAPLDVEEKVVGCAKSDGKQATTRLPEDPGQAGKAQTANYSRLLAGHNVKFVRPTGSKRVRAKPASAMAERRQIKLVRGEWNKDFLDEVSAFPVGKHDDIVDALSDLVDELTSQPVRVFPAVEEALLISPFPIPRHWPRAYAVEIGYDRMTALWGAWDDLNKELVIYGEYVRDNALADAHATAIKARGKWLPGLVNPKAYGRTPEDAKQLRKSYKAEGLKLRSVDDAIDEGNRKLTELMLTGRLKVFGTLSTWRDQISVYSRDDNGKPINENVQLMNTMRYLALYTRYFKTQPVANRFTKSAAPLDALTGY